MKLLFVVTEDWYFVSHRLNLAAAAVKSGHEVLVVTRIQKYREKIESHGIRVILLKMTRKFGNPVAECSAIYNLWKIYKQEQPDILHLVALKPVVYGGLAALFYRKAKIVYAIAGLGYVFSSKHKLARVLQPIIRLMFRILLSRKSTITIVQNPDDRSILIKRAGVNENRLCLIRGAGVDVSRYQSSPEKEGSIRIVLVSRMLWHKGINEFVEAAKILQNKGLAVNAQLAGIPDIDNPGSVPQVQLEAWHQEGVVEWLGYIDNITELWANSHIAVLPSYYGEGVPKSLIEAAACGRPIITTDSPGCKEIVKNGENGILVKCRNIAELVNAIEGLVVDKAKRLEMGCIGRKFVLEHFSDEKVIVETFNIYKSLVSE